MISQLRWIEGAPFKLADGALQSVNRAVLIEHRRAGGHRVQDASFLQRDYRTAACDRLHWHNAEVFYPWKQERASPAVVQAEVVVADESEKLHVSAKSSCERPKRFHVRSRTHDLQRLA